MNNIRNLSLYFPYIFPKYMFTTYKCLRSLHTSPILSVNFKQEFILQDSALDNVELKSSDNKQIDILLESLSLEDSQKLKVLKLEFDVFYSKGERVPDKMKNENWIHILNNCFSVPSRIKYYNYLFRIEKQCINRKVKAQKNIQIANEKYLKIKEQVEAGLIGNFKNTFLLKLIDATIHRHENNNLCYSMQFGPHLVFDASYDDQMSLREVKDLVNQLQLCHGINKTHPYPFHFHFCNLKRSGVLFNLLKPSLDPDKIMISHTEENYTKIYPNQRLVYLSPNAPNVLQKFNHDDVYIIGCLVDKATQLPLSLARAKRDGIRTFKLPLDQHIKWMQGSKALTLNHMVEIMLKVKTTNKWYDAFVETLPKRKIFDYEQNKYIGIKNK